MSYDWTAEDDMVRCPEGYHRLKMTKVIRRRQDGTEFKSQKGDPQLMVIFAALDADGAECSQMFTLSTKAAWTLKRLLARSGVDLEALNAKGVEPGHFADETIAHKVLVGRELWAHVKHDGPKYYEVTPMPEDEVPVEDLRAAKVAMSGEKPATKAPVGGGVDDDLPFGPIGWRQDWM